MRKEITVVGGFYRERCRFPLSDEFWGSGGRAAAAIAELEVDANFVTAVDTQAARILASIGESVGFKYTTEAISETISFSYDHGLSTPIIWPPVHSLKRAKLRASGDCLLQFGMLEAEAEVEAETVIYDPQEPLSPRHFQSNRKPSRLAYVVNRAEARKLGSNDNSEEAAKQIALQSRANVVIVKQGPLGALVLENGKTARVPAFKTSAVWPIGSGDVFAAVFAAEWGIHEASASEAAKRASLATAEYVENRVLPIQRSAIVDNTSRQPIELSRKPLGPGEYDIYLAGPFFNMPQLWLIDEARLALRGMGLKVFSPYHDVGIGRGKDVAPKDIEALERSRAVLAIIDGVDTGTIFEAGYARAHAKPVVALAQSTPEEPLKMIAGTGCDVVKDFVSAIYRVAWAAWR